MAVPCGADTVHGPLPPCAAGLLQELDADEDGCAEPYSRDSSDLCGNKDEPDFNKPPPRLNQEEFSCVLEGFMLFTEESKSALQQFSNNTQVQRYLNQYPVGECVPCGRANQAPCTYMDFLGCMVQEGYILDPDTVRDAPLRPLRHDRVVCRAASGAHRLLQPLSCIHEGNHMSMGEPAQHRNGVACVACGDWCSA